MARVSQAHLDARRRQILEGAARCFARNGFHATSMQDVLKEADLSAGAVYRYFSGKEELIGAIAAEVLEGLRAAFAEEAEERPLQPPDVVVGRVFTRMMDRGPVSEFGGRTGFPRLMIQVWTETLRNPELAALTREGFLRVRAAWVRIVRQYQREGLMRDDLPAEHVAQTMIALAQGFAAQQAVFGETPVENLQDGLRALMSMGGPGPVAAEGGRGSGSTP
ncbi:TetR/AcrR family transcriptional regulator [Streptomyces physcomitrii]|uniref:TetR/AcrR family transcriptional regulator n=1 Tax=Streptomyces physcomitrii TaxID=2724184 RepID=A0ABX1H3N7_9ACTN|nr:TetR/AcrR family transcriptional regulator [Streptomyces physcomitrii]NKI41894.1 TetR/AcrR family transcriptional regulator [Streptomyces physcomitrii]